MESGKPRVGFLSTDWSAVEHEGKPTPGGANWYRIQMAVDALNASGQFEAFTGMALEQMTTGEFRLHDFDGTTHDGLEYVVIQRWMDQHAPDCIAKGRRYGQVIINDIDDWWWGLSPKNRAFYGSHPKYSPQANTMHYAKACANSDLITCSTPFLAEKMHQKTSNASLLVRNRVRVDDFKQTDVSGAPIVGWVGTIAHRSGDLEILKGLIGPWCVQAGASVFHGGADNSQMTAMPSLGIPKGVRSKTMPMQTIFNYPRLFTKFNIGIVPLSSVPFNEAKSAIKGMEMAAAGIPFIASATPEYVWLRETHGIGFTASKPKEWLRYLNVLSDEDARVKIGAEFRQRVQALSPEGLSDEWAGVLATAKAQRHL